MRAAQEFPWPGLAWSWVDAAKQRAERSAFTPSRAAERAYQRQLRSVAEQIIRITQSARPEDAERALREYAEFIDPWAKQCAANMIMGVRRKNDQAWASLANRMGLDLRRLMAADPAGLQTSRMIRGNADLIKDIAIGTADRIAAAVQENLISGGRAEDLAARVAEVGEMSMARARVIALTETSKASTALTLTRAQSVGSEGYIWRTAGDGDTRPSHRAMEGKFVPWDKPPVLDTMTGHAGEFPNCRCYPEPVIPKTDTRKTFAPALPTRSDFRARPERPLLSQWERQPEAEVIPHTEGGLLPNVDRASLPMPKFEDYALNPEHASGRHKAKLFAEKLGITKKDAAWLREYIETAIKSLPAERGKSDIQGERFTVYVPITGPNGKSAMLETGWIYKRPPGSDTKKTTPSLTTVFLAKKVRHAEAAGI